MNKRKTKYLIFILFLSIFLFSCNNRFSLEQTIYVDSIGLDYNKDTNEFTLYYHIATSSTLLSTEMGSNSTDNSYSIGMTTSDSIYQAIKDISLNTTRNIALTHIQSVIFSKNFLNNKNLLKFVEDIKSYELITPNFYCFYTDCDLKEIYSVQNPEYISSFFSIITTTNYLTTFQLVYFTNIARSVYEDYILLKLTAIHPYKGVWQNEDKEIITIRPIGDFYLKKNDETLFLKVDDYQGLIAFNNDYNSKIVCLDREYTIYNQKLTIKEKNNSFTIKIRGNIYATNVTYTNQTSVAQDFNNYITEEIYKLIEVTKKNDFDIFNLKNILYRKNKLKNGFDYKTVQIKLDVNYFLQN